MKIAIVILNWNGEKLLEKFIPSIVKYSKLSTVEIVLADNNSTDDSVAFIEKNFPQITIVKNAKNGGYAKGYNDALKHVSADIYALVNSDIEVTDGWLNTIISIFENEPETAIIQPKILDYKDKSKFEYAGAAGGFIDKFGYPYCRGRIFNNLETDKLQYNDITEIFWASGACFFIRASIFNQLNGFDENYFAHQEEIDLCWRTKNLQKNIKYVGTSTVFHIGGATLKEASPRKTFLNFRNSLFTLVKNLPTNKLIPIIFSRLVLDGIAAVKFIVELRPKHTLAIVKAHISFYYYLPTMLKKRKSYTQNNNYYTRKSIVWSYFVLGKKTFRDL
ncbi:MAG: glycosyltransferase family 2 protein [Lutibacter sp.]|uniref:glycosyltransferase family 2 protein n=1 Tax=Lutibacter sp. TaxID=1925666 RepID=UPI0017CE2942|nr:glycosyltransferase family 2 protein [Lutibacter sp.]MBT8317035.1 glycosyltransferase family 2 protein [Lutibacter sp.]NNJ57895.1 glycosyltransferase family 2 protein [Lutibacter sp.]